MSRVGQWACLTDCLFRSPPVDVFVSLFIYFLRVTLVKIKRQTKQLSVWKRIGSSYLWLFNLSRLLYSSSKGTNSEIKALNPAKASSI